MGVHPDLRGGHGQVLLVSSVHVLEPPDRMASTWSCVMPGDVVISPGSLGFRIGDDEPHRPKTLQYRPLLVISRHEQTLLSGAEGSCPTARTFIVLSRHGLLRVSKSTFVE